MKKHCRKILSLIEVLISIVLISAVFIPLTTGLTSGAKTSSVVSQRNRAVWYTKQKIESVHYEKNKSGYWNVRNMYSSPVTENIDIFTRTTTITPYMLTLGVQVVTVNDTNGTAVTMNSVLGDY